MGRSKGKVYFIFHKGVKNGLFINQQCFMKLQSLIKYSYAQNSSHLCKQCNPI